MKSEKCVMFAFAAVCYWMFFFSLLLYLVSGEAIAVIEFGLLVHTGLCMFLYRLNNTKFMWVLPCMYYYIFLHTICR